MADILINGLNFHESWGGSTLQYLLKEDAKVLILPLSGNDGWGSDARAWEAQFRRGRKQYEALVRPFRAFGIKDEQIQFLNYYEDEEDRAYDKIRRADILYLVGRNPLWMMQRLQDLRIADAIASFPGTVIGNAAGAMILMDTFTVWMDDRQVEEEGLGRVGGFVLDLTFDQTVDGVYRLIRAIEKDSSMVVAAPRNCGVLVDGSHFDLLGESILLGPEDLDRLYDTVQADPSQMV